MNKNYEYTNTPQAFPTSYLFDLYSLTWEYKELEQGKETYVLSLDSLATNSIISNLQQKIKNDSFKIINRDFLYIGDTKKEKYESYEHIFSKIQKILLMNIEKAKKQGKTLIIWFSSLWAYDLLENLKETICLIKEKYPNTIFTIWWSDYNELTDQTFLERTLDWWIDLINIWWAEEFIDFITNLNKNDIFYRAKDWKLKLETNKDIAQNILLSWQLWNTSNIIPWKKIETTYDFDLLEWAFHFMIKNSECLNSCSYCSNYLHSDRTPLRNKDIEESITKFNKYIKKVEKETDEKLAIMINNPNPFQYIDKFFTFLQWIDLSNARTIVFFGDFTGLSNINKYNKVILIINYLRKTYPELEVRIGFSFDAIEEKGDADYIGRTNWTKISKQQELINWFKRFENLNKIYLNDEKVTLPYNTILHPNLSVEQFKNRSLIINKLWEYNKGEPKTYTLEPMINTKISKEKKWYFIPPYDVAKNRIARDLYAETIWNISTWGYYYKNSALLDIFEFSRDMWLIWNFIDLVENKTEEIKNYINNNKLDLLNTFLYWWLEKIKHNPLMLENNIEYWLKYIEYFLYREEYIFKNNPNYCSKWEYKKIISLLNNMKKEYKQFFLKANNT